VGFVEDDGAGDGGVEAFDGAGAGDCDVGVGEGEPVGREAGALVADEDGDAGGEVGVGEFDGAVGADALTDGGEEFEAAGLESAEVVEIGGGDGHAEDGADAGAKGLAVPGTDGAGSGEETGGAEGLGGADERAEVTGVLEADGDEDEGDAGEELVDGADGREHEGGDSLGGAGVHEAVEDVAGEAEDFDGGGDEVRERMVFGEEDGFEEHAGAEGFLDEVIAFEGDEAATEAHLAGKGAAELLDAGVGAAGDDVLGYRHRCDLTLPVVEERAMCSLGKVSGRVRVGKDEDGGCARLRSAGSCRVARKDGATGDFVAG